MPIRIDNELPAKQSLEIENIFVMSNKRADTQDIRPLHIIILNLMPTKIDTETQLLRLLSNTPLAQGKQGKERQQVLKGWGIHDGRPQGDGLLQD